MHVIFVGGSNFPLCPGDTVRTIYDVPDGHFFLLAPSSDLYYRRRDSDGSTEILNLVSQEQVLFPDDVAVRRIFSIGEITAAVTSLDYERRFRERVLAINHTGEPSFRPRPEFAEEQDGEEVFGLLSGWDEFSSGLEDWKSL